MTDSPGLNAYRDEAHAASRAAGWWEDDSPYIVPARLCLIHSEISEATEGHRKSLMDTHLPDRPMIEVELADALIRIFDLAGYLGLDLDGAYRDKRAYNATRADHSREARARSDGKRY